MVDGVAWIVCTSCCPLEIAELTGSKYVRTARNANWKLQRTSAMLDLTLYKVHGFLLFLYDT